jgi:hypothetical protein
MFQRLTHHDPLRGVQIRQSPDEILESCIANIWPLGKWFVWDVLLKPPIPKHPQNQAVGFIVANVFHEPIDSFLVSEVTKLTLQANNCRQCALSFVCSKIIVNPKDDTPKYSKYTLETYVSEWLL